MLNLMLACMQPLSEPILETPDTQDTAKPQEDCTNGMDDDGDGQVDCADSDCDWQPICSEDCQDGVDNDLDGLVDCEDGDCALGPPCSEDCYSSEDDDDDGLKNCEDDDCWGAEACLEYGAKVRLHGGGSGFIRQTKRLQSTYFADGRSTYGYTISFSNSAQFDDIEGRVRTTVEGSTVACDWSVDSVLMGRGVAGSSYSYVYGQAFGLDLVARSGFQTSGACGGLGSEFLPTKFAVASYSGIGATDKDLSLIHI